MKIAIGSDHGGYSLKETIKEHLIQAGHQVVDLGTDGEESVDYPDFAEKVADAVLSGQGERGIILCGTGIGISIAANKIPGIRAALLADTYSARMAREHNNANIIALGGRVTGPDLAIEIVDAYLGSEFLGDRHKRRVDKITGIENKFNK